LISNVTKALLAEPAAWVASQLLTLLHNRVPHRFSREEIRHLNVSFSQFGEDLAVARWIERIRPRNPIYVDVGCFHPIHCSNTLLLHKQGWRGVNIDADAEKIACFNELRPNDCNVVAAVSSSEEKMLFLRYEVGLTNRLAGNGSPELCSAIGETPRSSVMVTTRTLDNILEQTPWPISEIGYLNIDCEGHDLEVIKALDFGRYKPAIITIEALTPEDQHRTREYLLRLGYEHAETIYKTLLFVKHALGCLP
jgi:FkbM family methyltransferase